MRRSKRFEVLAKRPVNQDGLIGEWPEEGLIAMESPYDPASSVKVENGRIVELDGKSRAEFDMIDRFIADYAINVAETERAMRLDVLEIARMLVDKSPIANGETWQHIPSTIHMGIFTSPTTSNKLFLPFHFLPFSESPVLHAIIK